MQSCLPLAERDRRWAALTVAMQQAGFDALVFAASDHRGHKGALRYVGDYNLYHRHGFAALAPGGEPALILPAIMADLPRSRWIADQRHVAQPAAGLVAWLAGLAAGARVGVVGLGQVMRAGDYLHLTQARPDLLLADATDLFDAVRLRKSAVEIDGLREAAMIADACFADLLDLARPGETERRIGARMTELCLRRGGEDPLFLTMNAAWHDGDGHDGSWRALLSPPRARELAFGTAFTFSFELIGPSGYWTELCRMMAFGRRSRARRAGVRAGGGAADAGCAALRPGGAVAAIQRAIADAVDPRHYELSGWSGHSIGLDVIEPPAIGPPPAADALLSAGMAVALHPLLVDRRAGPLFYMADTLVIAADGAHALSAWPRALYVR
jgi:Xaa-Pro aminopeptidase